MKGAAGRKWQTIVATSFFLLATHFLLAAKTMINSAIYSFYTNRLPIFGHINGASPSTNVAEALAHFSLSALAEGVAFRFDGVDRVPRVRLPTDDTDH